MPWIDYVVGGIVIVVGLFMFYKVLKEPLDLLFGFIGRMFGGIGEKVSNGTGEARVIGKEIYYG